MGQALLVFAALWLAPSVLMLGVWAATAASPALRRVMRKQLFGPDPEPAPVQPQTRPRPRRSEPQAIALQASPGRRSRARSTPGRRSRRRLGQAGLP